ncbi:6-pyruvoyl tetrahydrobiopterin synthase-like isoform X1 [Saccoglossus kowalevskii]|uniref:6-pyruvoyltetrahydropterin synthase n=1 Tax=Saccoglossus kowalevskii TaxID=10224 RepID=A0ABM0GYY6_SACKO|nr:PREDICTED: 6-pyruvoyl tetrahydrobiopterin synthase-like [Saccoglossus kowalevskii]
MSRTLPDVEEPGHAMYLSRTEFFSAAHCLHSKYLNDEENRKAYGVSNNMNGYNYRVKVTIKGKVEPTTGYIIDLLDLKKLIKQNVIDELDHRQLDRDVPYFKDRPSTVENIVLFIWHQMKKCLPEGILHEIEVHNSNNNCVKYLGE